MEGILNYTNYHLVGIQGVGMSALAHILIDMGKKVSGSDSNEEYSTVTSLREKNIPIYRNFHASHVRDANVVIYTGAHGGVYNDEVVAAKESGIKVVPLAEIVGELSRNKKTIAIAGCHGKTTTSSLMTIALQKLSLHPSWYVGASSFGNNNGGGWDTQGEYFVVEADEYVADPNSDRRAKFLLLKPKIVLLTSFDFDHPDVYSTRNALEETYLQFVKSLESDSILIVNGNDPLLLKIFNESLLKNKIAVQDSSASGTVELLLSGEHNRKNASLVIATLNKMGITQVPHDIFQHFTGAKRRSEIIYTGNNSYLYDDYGHHPTEIKATIQGLRERHPGYFIAVIFQPHTYSRTALFVDDFREALAASDAAFILPIFSSKRERPADFTISANDIAVKSNTLRSGVVSDLPLWMENVLTHKKCVIVTMGAGDVNNIHQMLQGIIQAHEK